MHVFLITQYFHPEIGAAASRWGDYVNLLIKKGHKVTVLCQMPNYPHGIIFEGYKNQWVKKEKLSNNLAIIRCGVWANNRRSTIKILGNYFSFVVVGFINSLKINNYDLIIISSPPLFVGLIGIFIKKIKNCTILLDLRDIWPESVLALGGLKSSWLLTMGRWLEKKLYRIVDGYIFPVPGFINYFKESFPEELKKPMFNLMNGVDKQFLENSIYIKEDDFFTVLYSGNMGIAQGLEVLIDCAEKLIDYPIKFRFIGNGVKKQELIELAKIKNLKNVSFHNSMNRTEIIQQIKRSSVCIVPLIDKKLFSVAIPSKIFEIMACSKPIILGVKGEAEKIIKKSDSGIIVDPENLNQYKKAILSYYNNKDLANKHGRHGVTYVTNYMQKESLLSEFLLKLENRANVL